MSRLTRFGLAMFLYLISSFLFNILLGDNALAIYYVLFIISQVIAMICMLVKDK